MTFSKQREMASENSAVVLLFRETIRLSTVAKGEMVTVDDTVASVRFIARGFEEFLGPYLPVIPPTHGKYTTACTFVFPISR